MQHNLVNAFAGDPASSRMFLHLKLLDSTKDTHSAGQKFRQHKDATLENILATMQLAWLAPTIGEAIVVNGSGSIEPSTVGCKTASAACIVQPSSTAWRRQRIRACLQTQDDTRYPNRTELHERYPNGDAHCCPPHNSWAIDTNNEERLILSHLGIAWCGEAIPRYEHANGRTFSMVVFARPDGVWWNPVVPWCAFNWERHMLGCDGPACDMTWVVPRKHFDRMSRQYEMHRECPPTKARWEGRHVCCTTSEHLLSFARGHRNATHIVPKDLQLPLSNMSKRFTTSMSVLRSVKGICDIVMSSKLNLAGNNRPASNAAGHYAFFHQQWSGLLLSTQLKLRYLFVRNETWTGRTKVKDKLERESAACERALMRYGLDGHYGTGV